MRVTIKLINNNCKKSIKENVKKLEISLFLHISI